MAGTSSETYLHINPISLSAQGFMLRNTPQLLWLAELMRHWVLALSIYEGLLKLAIVELFSVCQLQVIPLWLVSNNAVPYAVYPLSCCLLE